MGATHFLATGEILTEATLESLPRHEAILFGAVGGDPTRRPLGGRDHRAWLVAQADSPSIST